MDTVVVEIRPAEGGDDAKMFTQDLFRVFAKFCQRKGWEVDITAMREAQRGYHEIVFTVKGKGALKRLLLEAGGHRVQRVPPTERKGRRQSSTVTVAVLLQPSAVELDIRPSDIRIETMRSSGPGGQHANKTDSAVRITHIPTGVNAYAGTKSQNANKKRAMEVLRSRLYQNQLSERRQSHNNQRAGQIGTGMRGDKVRTIRYQDGRVLDHRTGKKINLKTWLAGDLDTLV